MIPDTNRFRVAQLQCLPVGVICYLCLSDRFPFNAKSRQELFQLIVDGDYSFPPVWESVSKEAVDFIKQLLTVDPKERPSAEKALAHPWLAAARQGRASVPTKFEATNDAEKLEAELSSFSAMTALDNLKKATVSKKKEVIKTFIASQLLLSEEKKAINAVFRDLDITCNGKLSRAEVKAAYFKFFGYMVTDEELEDIFKRVDVSGTGFIGYDEFVVASLHEKVLLHQDKLRKAVSTTAMAGFCLKDSLLAAC